MRIASDQPFSSEALPATVSMFVNKTMERSKHHNRMNRYLVKIREKMKHANSIIIFATGIEAILLLILFVINIL